MMSGYSQKSLGVKAGMNLSNSVTKASSGDSKLDNRLAYYFGGYYSRFWVKKLEFQEEVVLSFEGGRVPGTSNDVFKYTYINLPTIIRYHVLEKLSRDGGFQLGFLVKSVEEINDLKTKPEYQGSTNFSLALGAGYKISELINASFRYNMGLDNQNTNPDTKNSVKTTNRTLQFGVAFKLK